ATDRGKVRSGVRIERVRDEEITAHDRTRSETIERELLIAILAAAQGFYEPAGRGRRSGCASVFSRGALLGIHDALMRSARGPEPGRRAKGTRSRAAAGRNKSLELRRNPRRAGAPADRRFRRLPPRSRARACDRG